MMPNVAVCTTFRKKHIVSFAETNYNLFLFDYESMFPT